MRLFSRDLSLGWFYTGATRLILKFGPNFIPGTSVILWCVTLITHFSLYGQGVLGQVLVFEIDSRNFDFHLSPLSLEPRRDGGRRQSRPSGNLGVIGNPEISQAPSGGNPLPLALGVVKKRSLLPPRRSSIISPLSPDETIIVTPASPKCSKGITLRTPSPCEAVNCKQIVRVEIH